MTNLPTVEAAEQIAQQLISNKTAACVHIMPPIQSIYHWQGKIERVSEVPLWIKSTNQHYADIEQLITQLHPYELPEIICVPILDGLPAYLDWVNKETNR